LGTRLVAVTHVQIPHFEFPFRFTVNGEASVNEQGSPKELEQNVRVLFLTPLGERLEVPEFGVEDPTFQTEIDENDLIDRAVTWDDRIDVLLQEEPDKVEAMVRTLSIDVRGAGD
jgi:hypothetical protein